MSDLHHMIMKQKYTLKDDISEEARNMLKGLLDWDPNKRFTTSDVLSHPWMQGIPRSIVLFNDQEMELIRKEFTFKNVDWFNRNNRL